MRLRELEDKDKYMIMEWISDKDIVKFFKLSNENITYNSIEDFIKNSIDDKNINYAIVNDKDKYLGTISLKNIDFKNDNAEYAVVLRKCAIGKGVGRFATKCILKIAFMDLHLNKLYLNVLSNNLRAISFYEKMKFELEGEFKNHIKIGGEYKDIKWYSITKKTYMELCKNE